MTHEAKTPSIEEMADIYAHKQGDDCLCQRTQPGTTFGEHIFCFCGCDVHASFLAGAKAQQEFDAGVMEKMAEALVYVIGRNPKDGEAKACLFCDMGGAGYSTKGDNHHDDVRDVCPILKAEHALAVFHAAKEKLK